jgi:hypothetical protein
MYYIHFFGFKYIAGILIIMGRHLSPESTPYLLGVFTYVQLFALLYQVKMKVFPNFEP